MEQKDTKLRVTTSLLPYKEPLPIGLRDTMLGRRRRRRRYIL